MNYSKIKSFFSNQFAMSFIILILLLLIVIVRQNAVTKDFKELISFSNTISKINNNSIEKTDLSSKSFGSKFSTTIQELKEIEKSITALKVSDKYSKHKNLLLDGLNKNITLHNNLDSMLKNPSNDTLSSKNKECIDLKNQINSIYKQCSELKLPVSLGKDDNSITYSSLNYINELIKLNRDKDITNIQSTTYIAQVENIYTKFSPLNEDLFTIINLMNEEKRSLSTVLDDTNKKIKEFEELKLELYSLSVPIELIDSFNSLKIVFDKYDSYINSTRNYLLHELNNSSNNALLEKAKDNYEALNLSIEDFQKELSNISIN